VKLSLIQAEEAQKRAYEQQRTSMLDRLASETVEEAAKLAAYAALAAGIGTIGQLIVAIVK
jgi:hypothetical protein